MYCISLILAAQEDTMPLISEVDCYRILAFSLSEDCKEGNEFLKSYVGEYISPLDVKTENVVEDAVEKLRMDADSVFSRSLERKIRLAMPISPILHNSRGYTVVISIKSGIQKGISAVGAKAWNINEDPSSRTEFRFRRGLKKTEVMIKSSGLLPPVANKIFPKFSHFMKNDVGIDPYGHSFKVNSCFLLCKRFFLLHEFNLRGKPFKLNSRIIGKL